MYNKATVASTNLDGWVLGYSGPSRMTLWIVLLQPQSVFTLESKKTTYTEI